ncbi:Superoxide dismutase [Mn/Fe] [Phycisphaerales bacterium]|nr:Superoxide dismutase [Mn/Fe] [Phycisphaerales bacterium]
MQGTLNRRDLLVSFTAAGASAIAGAAVAQPAFSPGTAGKPSGPCLSGAALGWNPDKGQYALPPLPYAFNALEPHIDAKTMEVHHDKHHAAYVAGANKALLELSRIREGGDAGLVKHWTRELSFHLSGHINHTLFWKLMAPPSKGGGGQPSSGLLSAIERDFGAFEKFVAQFKAAAIQVEGGGWAWLVLEPISGRLLIVQQEKQQDMFPTGCRPLLGIDVWEHAYYLKYQNQRSAYVDGWFKVVDWTFVQCLFDESSR